MQTMITQSQKSAYGANQISPDQAKRTRMSPIPATMAHQPNHRPRARVDKTTQPQQTAKLPIANQIFAKPRLPRSKAKLATARSRSAAP